MKKLVTVILFCFCSILSNAQPASNWTKLFNHPPKSAKPWVFWYWMRGAVSKEGITADLEAMKQAGIAGAYLMTIYGPTKEPVYKPSVEQLSNEWWNLIRYSMQEAKRLDLQIAMHDCDGFALAGGPWITPELSMQKIVWSEKIVEGNCVFDDTLPVPQHNENYYKDIAVLAFPAPQGEGISSNHLTPKVTTSLPDADASFLSVDGNTKNFTSNENCWIQYSFQQSFTCRTIVIRTKGNNYQAHRLGVEVSDDGIHFHLVKKLEAPKSGWQDTDEDYTFSIKPVTAKYFRFVYDKKGSEPGAEDMDAAKWKPVLKLCGIELLSAPRIHQYEAKNGSVWRIASRTTANEIADSLCIPLSSIQNISSFFNASGKLSWKVPAGKWVILRMGHTSTGHTNATGGAAKGLECDKFNTTAVKIQYQQWYGKIIKHIGDDLSKNVLTGFHIDSWECGSQNWSSNFAEEFQKRRGYSLASWLPVYAGFAIDNTESSERVLYDIRVTIAELLNDKFFKTMADLAHADGKFFTAESVAPTMVSDGMLHYQYADVPMGEFWLRSPTHDKPNDMFDAVSGAHVYGKNIVQAEGFTQLRSAWDEYPGMLKPLLDRNFALGINRMVFHVFMHSPWMNKKPGMTLDGIGLFFQRNQTWWKQGKAFVDYITRCQTLLQLGNPVVDVAVFTGEEIPRRSVLPDRLVTTLPGIFGDNVVQKEKKRLLNEGQPMRIVPAGVSSSANSTDWGDWINSLNGYAYDAINKDALLRLAKVENGKIVLPGGTSYKILVLPVDNPMIPEKNRMSPEMLACIDKLLNAGAVIIAGNPPLHTISYQNNFNENLFIDKAKQIWNINSSLKKITKAPYTASDFSNLGLKRDIEISEENKYAQQVAYTHRRTNDADIYFIANQKNEKRNFNLSLRVAGKIPELWNAVTGKITEANNWRFVNGRTKLLITLDEYASIFIVLKEKTNKSNVHISSHQFTSSKKITGKWKLHFITALGNPNKIIYLDTLERWSKSNDSLVKYFSGTVLYKNNFEWKSNAKKVVLQLDSVFNIATVKINGINCGTIWTKPYELDITKAMHKGINKIEIEVTNTWANRMMGDNYSKKKFTYTTSPYQLSGKLLLPSGLTGRIILKY